jgi:hypothetical protein
MKKLINNLVVLSLLGFALVGCQTMPYQPYARDVKKKPNANGIIALRLEHREEDRAKAQTMMQANCQQARVNVLEEGEVVIGQKSVTDAQTEKNQAESGTQVGSLFGMPVVSGGRAAYDATSAKVETTQVKEWQISYECNTKKSTVK